MDTDDAPQPSEDMPKRSLWRSISVLCILSALAITWIVTATTPGRGGPLVILAFLFFIFVTSGLLIALIIDVVGSRISGKNVSSVRLLYTSVALASGIVFLVGLQTLRQLTPIDIILVIVFELLLNFYLLRRF